MNGHTNFKIIPEKKIIIEYFSGIITLDDVLYLKNLESQDPNYCPDFNIIDDSRDAEFILNENDIKHYIKTLRRNQVFVGKRNVAYLTKTPNQVVYATLFDMLKQELSINIKIVSTFDAAVKWVGLIDELDYITFKLDLLRVEKLVLSINKHL